MGPARLKSTATITVCYTRNQGNVYAALLDWNGGPVTLKALRAGGATLGKVSKVELLGSDSRADVRSRRSGADGDARRTGGAAGGNHQPAAGLCAAGSCASPMTRAGSMTTTPARRLPDGFAAATWAPATSTTTSPPATRLAMFGVVRLRAAASRSSLRKKQEPGRSRFRLTAKAARRRISPLTGARQAQQVVCEVTGLTAGKHAINIVNRGPGPVAVDALIAR